MSEVADGAVEAFLRRLCSGSESLTGASPLRLITNSLPGKGWEDIWLVCCTPCIDINTALLLHVSSSALD